MQSDSEVVSKLDIESTPDMSQALQDSRPVESDKSNGKHRVVSVRKVVKLIWSVWDSRAWI